MKSLNEMLILLKQLGHYSIDREENIVLTREQIGDAISFNYQEAQVALETNLFMDTFKSCDNEMANILLNLESKFEDSNQILFHLQYALDPNLTFTYKEMIYRDISKIGEQILIGRGEKNTIIEAMRLRLFSHYARLKQLDTVRADLIEHIEKAENYLDKDPEIAIYLLGYFLTDRKYYVFEGKKFLSVVTLYEYLCNKKKLIKFSKGMEQDILFIAWLFSLDKGDVYEKWLKEVETIDNIEYEQFMTPATPKVANYVYPNKKEVAYNPDENN